MTNNFSETRLDLGIDYGTTSTITTRTSIVVLGDGSEQRNANWEQPLLRFQIGQRTLQNTTLSALQTSLAARKGALQGFRFRDWGDYSVKNQLIGVGDGENPYFQLVKTYTVAGQSVTRRITKPVNGTVQLYLDSVPLVDLQDYQANPTNGGVVFGTPPTGTLTADFLFDVPVRFEQDKIDFKFMGYEAGRKIFELGQLGLLEVRTEPIYPVPLSSTPTRFLEHTIALGYDYETLGGVAYSTQVVVLSSGHEQRIPNWDGARGSWDIGSRTLNRAELDYLIALFRVCRGRLTGFLYKDWASEINHGVRFGENSLSFRFDALEEETGRVIFFLAGTPLARTVTLTHLFGTYLSKGGPWDGSAYICNGACNMFLYWRTIDPVVQLREDYTFVVKDGFWYVKNGNSYYQIDFIYPNNYLAEDIGTYRGFPQGPFSPHGVGIAYVESEQPCVADDFNSPAYGDNPTTTFTVEV